MSAPRCVVGIDPGRWGAIVLYRPDAEANVLGVEQAPVMVWDMPHTRKQQSRNKFVDELDLTELCAIASTICGIYTPDRVICEKVGSRPGEGSGFTFGWYAAAVNTAFAAFGKRPELVTPARWKGECKAPAEKKMVFEMAVATLGDHTRRLFQEPHKTQKGKFVNRNDRAEAALLAWWGVNH